MTALLLVTAYRRVSKSKICLQVCLLDLDYNLPVQVRDQAMGLEDEVLPESDVGKEFALERMSNEGELGAAYERAKANETIMRLQRTAPYYQVCATIMLLQRLPLATLLAQDSFIGHIKR